MTIREKAESIHTDESHSVDTEHRPSKPTVVGSNPTGCATVPVNAGVFRPILFSAPMVRALLAGTKTQTRRVVTGSTSTTSIRWSDLNFSDAWVDNTGAKDHGGPGEYLHVSKPVDGTQHRVFPRIQIGDRLWVRETWRLWESGSWCGSEPLDPDVIRGSLKSLDPEWLKTRPVDYRASCLDSTEESWRPSIFMPRWASRLTLEVTDVRVERVNHISEADAKAEGVESDIVESWFAAVGTSDPHATAIATVYRAGYRKLWDAINGKREGCSWDDNPWVWAISFRRVAS